MSKFKISQKKDQKTTWVFWLIMCFVSLSLIISPFYRALFNGGQYLFERPIFIFTTWTSVALMAIAIYMFKRWKLHNIRDIMAIAIWLIPLTYLISMLNAASYYSSIQELYLHIVYTVFFLIGAYFYRSNLGAAILQYGLIVTGYIIVVHGLLNWFGNIHYFEAILANQLSGVFQYPNAYAAYLVGILIVALIFITNSSKWYTIIPHAVMLVPIMVSILLTLSRGGMIIMPLAVLLYLVWIPWRKQLFVLLYLGLAGGAALAIYGQLTSIQVKLNKQFESSQSLQGWGIVFAVSIVIAAVVFLIHKYIAIPQGDERERTKIFYRHNFIVPISVLIISILSAVLLFGNNNVSDQLPNGLKQRIQSVNFEDSSITQRAEFYKDSFDIVKDYPLIGAGGGAWASLYDQYKSFPYTSAQTHNVISQVLVDTGIIGFIVFVLFIVLCWYIFIRTMKRRPFTEWNELILIYPIFGLTLLLHSTLDFDLSFVYLSALLYLSLGVLVSHSDDIMPTKQGSLKAERIAKIYPALAVVIALILFVNAFQAFRANKLFMEANKATTTTQNYEDIVKPLGKALDLQKNHPYYNLFKANVFINVFSQTKDEKYGDEAEAILKKVQKTEPHSKQLIDMKTALLISRNEYAQAADWVESKLPYHPWDAVLYEKAIMLNFDAGNQARLQNDSTLMKDRWNKALTYYEQFKDKIVEYNQLPKSQQVVPNFDITQRMALIVGQIRYYQGQYDYAFSQFSKFISMDVSSELNRVTARWYLATMMRINQKFDETIYADLINAYPDEKQIIDDLVAYSM